MTIKQLESTRIVYISRNISLKVSYASVINSMWTILIFHARLRTVNNTVCET